jgi:hypothetical protein
MKTLSLLTILYSLLLFSCAKDDTIPTFGEEVLTSSKFIDGQTYYVNGFSFSKASQVKYTLGGTESPDIILNEMIDQNGAPYDVYMSSPSNYHAFKLYNTYASLQDAEAAFTAYKLVTETIFTDKTSSLAPNAIYTYKSNDGKYAKILIKGVQKIETSGVAPFFSISIKWSTNFD